MALIYGGRCVVNNKMYVGQTIYTLEERKHGHEKDSRCKRDKCRLLQRAMRKHGIESFEWTVLRDNLEIEDLDAYEAHFIRKLKSLSPGGYNLREGGKQSRPSEESRRRLSKSLMGRKTWNKGRPHSEETKRKIGLKSRGRLQTAEAKLKISESLKAGYRSGGVKKRIVSFKGLKHTDEAKRKMSIRKKGKPAWNKGKKWSESTKLKMRKPKSEQGRQNMRDARAKRKLENKKCA